MLSDEQLAYTEEKGFAGPSAVSALVNEIRELRAQREAVLALHSAFEGVHGETVCSHRYCVDGVGDQCPWPCATVRSLGVTE